MKIQPVKTSVQRYWWTKSDLWIGRASQAESSDEHRSAQIYPASSVEQSRRTIMDIRAQLAFLQLRPPRASQIFRLQLRRETLFHPGDFRLANEAFWDPIAFAANSDS
jgi:hypothetical protein